MNYAFWIVVVLAAVLIASPRITITWKSKEKIDPIQAKYLAALNSCPFCGSEDVEGDFVETDSSEAWQPVTCNNCGKGWNDLYKLVGFEEEQ